MGIEKLILEKNGKQKKQRKTNEALRCGGCLDEGGRLESMTNGGRPRDV